MEEILKLLSDVESLKDLGRIQKHINGLISVRKESENVIFSEVYEIKIIKKEASYQTC
jgi:hypothetical protein